MKYCTALVPIAFFSSFYGMNELSLPLSSFPKPLNCRTIFSFAVIEPPPGNDITSKFDLNMAPNESHTSQIASLPKHFLEWTYELNHFSPPRLKALRCERHTIFKIKHMCLPNWNLKSVITILRKKVVFCMKGDAQYKGYKIRESRQCFHLIK